VRPKRTIVWLTLALSVLAVLGVPGAVPHGTSGAGLLEESELEGRDEREPVSERAAIEVAFAAESYRAGSEATLISFGDATGVTLQMFRVGDGHGTLKRRDVMRGAAAAALRYLGTLRNGQHVTVKVPSAWPSGLYFAQLSTQGRAGYAPVVVVPRVLGRSPVAVVLPTETWQAYNFRDDDGDGLEDTWYARPGVDTARLVRPFENRGVPPHYKYYDEPFLRWLARFHYQVDFLSDAELRTTSGAALRAAYRLLVFPGHHEYATVEEYGAVTEFRNRGGNLMFLSANNFFYKITIADGVMTRIGQWRKLGLPEAALEGVEYFAYDVQSRGGSPWKLTKSRPGRWIFSSTGLAAGDTFSSGGIEVDHTGSASPKGVAVLAEMHNVFGRPGQTAQMTFYATPNGAHVFAAGAFSLACSVWQRPVSRVVANLLLRLGGERGYVDVGAHT